MVPMYSYLLVYALHLPASIIGIILMIKGKMLERNGGKIVFALVLLFFVVFTVGEFLWCYKFPFWFPPYESIL